MAKLEGQSIASSYEQLLHVDRDGGGNTTTLVDVKDGKNTTTFALKLATDKAEIDGKLTIDQDSNSPALVIDTEATSEYAIHINSPAITTSDVININADALTTGSILDLSSDSSSNSSRQLVKIVNDNTASTGTVPLFVQQDAAQSGITLEQNGTAYGLNLDINGNGNGINVENAGTGNAIKIDQNGNAVALNIDTEGTGSAIYASSTATSSNSIIELYRAVDADGEYVAQWMGKAPSTGDALALSYYYHTGTDAYAELSIYGGNGLIVKEGGNVGIGSNTSPDNTLHVYKGSAGTVDGNANAPLVVENSGDTNIHLLSPNTSDQFILFGSNSGIRTYIQADLNPTASSESLGFYTNLTQVLKLDANSRISLSNNDSGTSNTIFGKLAGSSLDAGSNYNVFIGENVSDASMNDAIHNVGIGFSAISSLTDGDYNVAVGSYAGLSNTTGVRNINIGYAAGYSNQSGNYNVNIGHAAGYATTVSNLTAVGYNALTANTSGTGNVALGYQAGKAITVGSSNVAIGNNALFLEVGGGGSVAIGTDCMANQDGGDSASSRNNVGIGANAGHYNVTGQYNTYVGNSAGLGASGQSNSGNTGLGYQALTSVSTGGYNVAIGNQAGIDVTTGGSNIHIGSLAGDNVSDASHIIAIGDSAVRTGTTTTAANGTVAIGSYALENLTSSTANTAVGYQSLDALTSGSGENTAVGYGSLGALQTGAYNTAVGNSALSAMDGSESNNVAIGRSAGYNIDGGSDNVFVGRSTQGSSATATNQNVFGYHAAGVADNSVTLGNADVTAVYMAEDSGATVYCSGVNFPDTQSASADANTLDDYEEGEFNFSIAAGTNTIGLNSSFDRGSYVKIGSLVTVQAYVNNNSFSSASGTITFGGLPFTSNNALTEGADRTIGMIQFNGSGADGLYAGYIADGSTTMVVQGLTADQLDADVDIFINATYRVV